MTQTFPWQRSYQDAMLELNPVELPVKFRIAVSELQQRSRELLLARDSKASVEWQAIADARNNLSAIEKYELCAAAETGQPERSQPKRPADLSSQNMSQEGAL